MKRTSKAIIAIGFIVCAVLPYFFSGTAAFDGLETAEVTQALPEEGKYFYLNIFTEDDVVHDNPSSVDGNLIEIKMDYWNLRENVTSGWSYERTHDFHLFNSTHPDVFNVYSSAWGEYTICSESSELSASHLWFTAPDTNVRGGYKLVSYNDYFYRMESNTTLYAGGSPIIDDTLNYTIDPYMEREFNISKSLLLSKTNLTAYIINDTEWIEIDNPMYLNASTLSSMSVGENYTMNGLNYTLMTTNHYYELETNRLPHNYSYEIWPEGTINKTVTIRVRKNGEIWGFVVHKHYTEWDDPDGNGYFHVAWPVYDDEIKVEETLEFWMGDHFYRNAGYFSSGDPPLWHRYVIGGLIFGIPAVLVISIVVVVKKRRNKKGGN